MGATKMMGVGCEDWPPLLMGGACFLAAFVIMKWARHEDTVLPKWRWGDAPRRQQVDHDGTLGHVVGFALVAAVIAYALQHPFCG